MQDAVSSEEFRLKVMIHSPLRDGMIQRCLASLSCKSVLWTQQVVLGVTYFYLTNMSTTVLGTPCRAIAEKVCVIACTHCQRGLIDSITTPAAVQLGLASYIVR